MNDVVTRLEEILKALTDNGFEVIHQEVDQAVVRQTEDLFVAALTASDAWVQASQTLLESPEFADRRAAVATLAMRIHGRFLGCRFGFEDDGNLVAQYDVYPGESERQLATALEQMAYVAAYTLPLFKDCAAGVAVDDDRIDMAFMPKAETSS